MGNLVVLFDCRKHYSTNGARSNIAAQSSKIKCYIQLLSQLQNFWRLFLFYFETKIIFVYQYCLVFSSVRFKLQYQEQLYIKFGWFTMDAIWQLTNDAVHPSYKIFPARRPNDTILKVSALSFNSDWCSCGSRCFYLERSSSMTFQRQWNVSQIRLQNLTSVKHKHFVFNNSTWGKMFFKLIISFL